MSKAKRNPTPKAQPSAPQTTQTWQEMESTLWGDLCGLFYDLELRRALLDSNRHPPLKPTLEKEITDLESRFESTGEMFQTAKRFADRERAEQQKGEINPE